MRTPRAFVFAIIVLAALVPATPAESVALARLTGHVAPFVEVAVDQGRANADERISIAVALVPRDEPALRAAALATARGADPLPARVAQLYASPVDGATAATIAHLVAQGLAIESVSRDGALIVAAGRVGDVERAFHVELRVLGVGDRTLVANVVDPLVPVQLAPLIRAVVGLTNATLEVRNHEPPVPVPGEPPYLASDLRAAYDVQRVIDAGADGRGRHVAITGWATANQTSFDEMNAFAGLPPSTLIKHNWTGGTRCVDDASVKEWDLDTQIVHAMAPAATVHMYCGLSNTLDRMLQEIALVVDEDVADVVSQSWGICENYVSASVAAAYEAEFLQGAAQGISFFTSSGNRGSRECSNVAPHVISTSFPATAPHTAAVGGTRLELNGTARVSEVVWDFCTPCEGYFDYVGSGGGKSRNFDRPEWQTAPANAGPDPRMSPDMAALADPETGVLVRSGGGWWKLGGTSVAAPIWAGIWTDVTSASGRLGNAGTWAWDVGRGPTNTSYFHDITEGDNGDYVAKPGYDMTSGWGTPKGMDLLTLLARAPTVPRDALATWGPAHGEISLTWSSPASAGRSAVTGYQIYRGPNEHELAPYLLLGNVTEFREEGLPNGTFLWYRVAAINGDGEGLATRVFPGETFGVPHAPVTRAIGRLGAIDVEWEAARSPPIDPVQQYVVEERVDAFNWTTRAVLPADARSWRDEPLPDSPVDPPSWPSYHYRVRAANALGLGSGVTVRNETDGVPTRIWEVWADDGPRSIAVRWNDPWFFDIDSPILGYRLYRDDELVATLAERTYMDADLAPDEEHNYSVAAFNSFGEGPRSSAVEGSAFPPPPQVGITARAGYRELQLTWWEPTLRIGDALVNYTVDMNGTILGAFSAGQTSFNITGLADNTTYAFGIRVNSLAGTSARADTTGRTYGPPSAPFTWVEAGIRNASLGWSVPSSPDLPVLEYTVYAGPSASALFPVATLPGSERSFVDEGLGNGERRSYAVTATMVTGVGLRSTVREALTPDLPAAPEAPSATAGFRAAELAWSAPTSDLPVTNYRIYRAESATAPGTLVAEVSTLSHRDAVLANATTYWFHVAAVSAVGEGALSPARSITTWGPPGAPSSVDAATRVPWLETVIDWAAPDTGGPPSLEYRVWQSRGGAAPTLLGSTSAREYEDRTCPALEVCEYAVSAWNGYWEGPRSAWTEHQSLWVPICAYNVGLNECLPD